MDDITNSVNELHSLTTLTEKQLPAISILECYVTKFRE